MEEITLERLLTDLKGVINGFNHLVANNDVVGVRKALKEIETLITNKEEVTLDFGVSDEQYDHVIHELISNIGGRATINRIIGSEEIDDEELRQLVEERKRINLEIKEIRKQIRELVDENPITEEVEVEEDGVDKDIIRKRLEELIAELGGEEPAPEQDEYEEEILVEFDRATLLRDLTDEDVIRQLLSDTRYTGGRVYTPEEIEGMMPELSIGYTEGGAIGSDDGAYTISTIVRRRKVEKELTEEEKAKREADRVKRVLVAELQELLDNSDPELSYIPLDRILDKLDGYRKEREELTANAKADPQPINQERIDEINRLLEESSAEIVALQNQRDELRQRYISELIDERNAQKSELQARLEEYRRERQELGQRILAEQDDPSKDQEVAAYRSRSLELDQEISVIESQIGTIDTTLTEIMNVVPTHEVVENIGEPTDFSVTYPGRLSDEEIIRRVLDAQGMSAAEINATIGEYSIIAVDSARDDDGQDDYPIALRQIVKTRVEVDEVTVGEVEERLKDVSEFDARRQELEARLAELRKEREELGRAILEAQDDPSKEQDVALYRARSSELVSLISELEQQITNIENEITRASDRSRSFAGLSGLSEIDRQITELQEQEDRLVEERERLEHPEEVIDPSKLTSEQAARYAELNALILEFENLERQKQTYKTTKTVTKPGKEYSEKRAELEAKLTTLIKERDRITRLISKKRKVLGVRGVKGDEVDVDQEIARIGDSIFKASDIRKELASRNISREEYEAFYQAGLDQVNAELDLISESYRKLREKMTMFVCKDGAYVDLINEANENGDDATYIERAEELRQRLVANGVTDKHFTDINVEITTKEQAEKFMNFVDALSAGISKRVTDLREKSIDLQESKAIFERELKIIREEMSSVKLANGDLDALRAQIDAEMELREAQIRATLDEPNEDIEREFDEAYERFNKARQAGKNAKSLDYRDEDGNLVTVYYDTISESAYENDPDHSLEKDIFTLNLAKFKTYTEIASIMEKTGNAELIKSLYPKEYAKLMENPERYLYDIHNYLDSYHGQANAHKVRYEVYKTAGSTLKNMKPVFRGNLSPAEKTKNVISNVFRFIGLRAPAFTRKDPNGEDKSNVGGAIATIAGDAIVAGGIAAAATLTGTVGAVALVPLGVTYAVRGAIIGVNKLLARREYRKYKDEIEANRPSLRQATAKEKQQARQDYYQKEEGRGLLRSWGRAWVDRLFARGRMQETHDKIKEVEVEHAREELEGNLEEAMENARENLEKAGRNQEVRQANYTKEALSQQIYNYIVANPEGFFDPETHKLLPDAAERASAIIARNAAIHGFQGEVELSTEDGRTTTVTVDGKQKAGEPIIEGATPSTKYVKDDEEYEQTEELKDTEVERGSKAATAVTVEERFRARTKTVDNANRIAQIVGTALGVAGFKYLQSKFIDTREKVIHHDESTRQEWVDAKTETRNVENEVTDYSDQYDLGGNSLNDVMRSNAGKTVTGYRTVSGGNTHPAQYTIRGDERITAIWQDDGSKWGTGLGDVADLNQGTGFIDRTVDATMLDANGYMNQGITIEQLANAVGSGKVNPATLEGTYVSVGDNYWTSLKDLMEGMVTKVPTGTHIEYVPTEVVVEQGHFVDVPVPAWDETVTESFTNWALGVNAVGEGAAYGTALGVAEKLEEAGSPTKRNTEDNKEMSPGTFEQVTPALRIMRKIAAKLRGEPTKTSSKKEETFEEEFEEDEIDDEIDTDNYEGPDDEEK